MQARSGSAGRIDRQLAWPFVGRDDELEWVASERCSGGSCGVVISGAAGVGKSRLARELVAAGVADGAVGEWVQATRAAASVPLAAFAALVPSGVGAGDRSQLFALCAEVLRERAASGRLMLGVDDAQLLDAASAALVLHAAQSEGTFVVVTVRASERCPDPIIALWKDAGALRLELQQFSEEETARLLESALGGELDPGVARWAFESSEGNVLYLRELVSGALAAGALEHDGGRWGLRFRPRVSPALVDLVSARLDGLGDDELQAARLLALGEPMAIQTLATIAGPDGLAGLEERGLAVVSAPQAAASGEARLAHPLYGEVVRDATPSMRARRLRRALADAVQAAGVERPGDALRVAVWLEQAGAPVQAPLLLAAAREANGASDPDLAERLARQVSLADGGAMGVEAQLIIARAHAMRRRFGDAERLLAGLEGRLGTVEPAGEYLAAHALLVLHLGLRRTDDALALLARARDWFRQREWVARVEAIELEVRATSGRAGPAEVIDAAERVLERGTVMPEVRRRAQIAYAFSLHQVGRTAEALAVAERVQPTAPLHDDDDVYALVPWGLVCLHSGYDWDQAERWLSQAAAAARADEPLTRGQTLSALGMFALWRGRPQTATRCLREAIPLMQRRDPLRRLPLAWLELAISHAIRGELDAAHAAHAEYRALVAEASVPWLAPQEALARGALALAEGNSGGAVAILLAAADDEPYPVDRGYLFYEALRAGAEPRLVAPELHAAADGCDAPLTGAFAQHAGALAAGDGPALVRAAEALGQIGAWLWAAEAAAHAALAHTHAGKDASARRALALSGRFQEQCEDVRSPVLAAAKLAPAELSTREREIVELAAHGHSNAQIAERLVLSTRTVESHLYRAMLKLGISSRHELKSLLHDRRLGEMQ
jgi:DNA-binding CsgD family transcriptional regulator